MRTLGSIIILTATFTIGCEQKADVPQEKAPVVTAQKSAAKTTPAKAEKAAPTKKAVAKKNFTINVISKPAVAGAQAISVVEVKPAPGFKMNADFPSSMTLNKVDGCTASKSKLSGDDAKLTKHSLRFEVGFTADHAGTLKMGGKADFSVCNESGCQLVRGEEIAWAVDVK